MYFCSVCYHKIVRNPPAASLNDVKEDPKHRRNRRTRNQPQIKLKGRPADLTVCQVSDMTWKNMTRRHECNCLTEMTIPLMSPGTMPSPVGGRSVR